MLELFIFCEVIICTLSLIGFIVSLGNCIKNGKFDFTEMFKILSFFLILHLLVLFQNMVFLKF